jgi:hypothetical protein
VDQPAPALIARMLCRCRGWFSCRCSRYSLVIGSETVSNGEGFWSNDSDLFFFFKQFTIVEFISLSGISLALVPGADPLPEPRIFCHDWRRGGNARLFDHGTRYVVLTVFTIDLWVGYFGSRCRLGDRLGGMHNRHCYPFTLRSLIITRNKLLLTK